MAKLTKAQSKAHAQAEELFLKDNLTLDDKIFVYENWNEAALYCTYLRKKFGDLALQLEVGRRQDRPVWGRISELTLRIVVGHWSSTSSSQTDLQRLESAMPEFQHRAQEAAFRFVQVEGRFRGLAVHGLSPHRCTWWDRWDRWVNSTLSLVRARRAYDRLGK